MAHVALQPACDPTLDMLSRASRVAQHMKLHRSMQLQAKLSIVPTIPVLRSKHSGAREAVAAAALPAAAASRVVFPHSDSINIDGREVAYSQIIDMLAPAVTPERLEKMQQVIAARSYGVVPVVEGLYDMGNLAAVCRSADAMGFGAVHCVMRPSDKYKQSQRTAAGADKWLDTRLWDNTADCLGSLKAAGYQIITTHLSASSITIQEVDFTRPTAFVLGNERAGVSETAVAMADHTAIIPMAGFVESFNISVAAALILYEAQQQRLQRLGSAAGDLDECQQQRLLAEFLMRSVKHSKLMVGQLLNRPPPPHQKRFFKGRDSGSQAAAEVEAAAAAAGDVPKYVEAAACDDQQAAEQAPQMNTGESKQQQQQLNRAANAA